MPNGKPFFPISRLHIPIEIGIAIGIGIVSEGSILAPFLMSVIPTMSQLGEHDHDADQNRLSVRVLIRAE